MLFSARGRARTEAPPPTDAPHKPYTRMTFVALTECFNPLDLVFLVDDSSSIRETDWPLVLSFLQAVVSRYNVSSVATRIGVVRYASMAQVIYRLTSFQSRSAVRSRISGMRHLGGSTDLAAAMRLAYQQVFLPAQRPGAAKVLAEHPSAKDVMFSPPSICLFAWLLTGLLNNYCSCRCCSSQVF